MTTRSLLALLALPLILAACGSEASGGETDGAGGGGAGASSGGDGGSDGDAGSGGGVEPGATLDLFGCGVAPDCVQDFGHLGEGLTDEAQRCGGVLAAAGDGGALLSKSNPGPYPTQIESLVVFGSDGTAYDQTRSRCEADGACGNQNTAEWRRTELRLCVIDVDPARVAGCGGSGGGGGGGGSDGQCEWLGETKDCVPAAEDWTCADLPQ
jgi:hypothetical protein